MEIIRLEERTKEEIVQAAVEILKNGGLLVYPTETCYGIGADATNQAAIDKLFAYKARREGKPLSIAVTDKEMASKYVEINDIASNLYENYLPGPITVVSKSLGNTAKGVESEYGTIGIRIPDYPLILEIVKEFGKPITSTSANASYQKRPYEIVDILDNISGKQKELIDLIIDAGKLPENEPSTVVDTTLNNLNVMREGSLKFNEDLKKQSVILKATTNSEQETIDFGSMVMLKFIDIPIERPLVFLLKGDLGAGKTQFSKGIAKALKINEQISSPTYTIIDEYKYKLADREGYLAHMDTWRVDGAEEFDRVGLEGYFKPGNVISIEWADKFYDQILELNQAASGKILRVEFSGISSREIVVYE